MDRSNEVQILSRIYGLNQDWIKNKRLNYALAYHRNIRGDKMDFDKKAFLIDIYRDNAQEIVLKSCVQIGKTEFLIVSGLSFTETGLQTMYVLPTDQLANQFVDNRVDKLFNIVPYYKQQIEGSTGQADNKSIKHFGKGTIFFAGSKSETTFQKRFS